mgnify:CR=1 FL=1
MEYRCLDGTFVLRLDPGDEVMESLRLLCERENIRLGTVYGLGAADRAELGLYRVDEKRLYPRVFEGPMEITSITGNITDQEGAVYLHLHATLCGADLQAVGGHLLSCRIAATGELFVHPMKGQVHRQKDDYTGLNIFRFS